MTARVYNFSPGPAVLPLPVLEQAQRDLLSLPGIGISPLEISHRHPWFDDVLAETEANLRELLDIPAGYRILFLQGGSRQQFSMVPLNLLTGPDSQADYIVTGSWGQTALQEAQRLGRARAAFDGKAENYCRLPVSGELALNSVAAYVHFTSNETIQGVQFLDEPVVGAAPLVCDASSDFMCRPLPVAKYGMIYACAQKNAGPAGVTVVIVREDLLGRASDRLPAALTYRTHAAEGSRWNTPPVFAVYLVMLVTRWLKNDMGGLAKMAAHNRRKANLLYDVLDARPDLYQGHARRDDRSLMNVTFRLPNDAVQKQFLQQAEKRGLVELKGHRSVGGVRASIYNAMPVAGVEALAEFMRDFSPA